MGNLYDYFAAAGDEAAASAFDLVSLATGGFDTVDLKGIDPVVQMGTLEELLTGRPYDEIIQDPRQGGDICHREEEGDHGVISLTDTLAAALADADRQRLAEVAEPWSETEEFWSDADPDILADVLWELAELARRARDRGHRLYCRWSL